MVSYHTGALIEDVMSLAASTRASRSSRASHCFQVVLDIFTRGLNVGRALGFACDFFSGRFYKRNPDDLLPIVALSYCWKLQGHPDPDGEQVKLLTSRLSRLYGGYGLLGSCQKYGFRDMGVFLDWCAQRDSNSVSAASPGG